jgi:hypothetical protein
MWNGRLSSSLHILIGNDHIVTTPWKFGSTLEGYSFINLIVAHFLTLYRCDQTASQKNLSPAIRQPEWMLPSSLSSAECAHALDKAPMTSPSQPATSEPTPKLRSTYLAPSRTARHSLGSL